MSRAVDEWIGASDDSRPPSRVRLRVFQRYEGRCYLSGRKIGAGDLWDLDHIKALINGGENRESNLAPALKAAHRIKTNADVAEKAKVDRIAKKHLGLVPTGSRWPKRCRKLNGSIGLTKKALRLIARGDDPIADEDGLAGYREAMNQKDPGQ